MTIQSQAPMTLPDADFFFASYSFLSYRTSQYKLHYYETPSNTKFVMLTDTKSGSMRIALHQIWVNIYVEFVVKNPLSPVEHPGGIGVNNELFEASLEQFVVRLTSLLNLMLWDHVVTRLTRPGSRSQRPLSQLYHSKPSKA